MLASSCVLADTCRYETVNEKDSTVELHTEIRSQHMIERHMQLPACAHAPAYCLHLCQHSNTHCADGRWNLFCPTHPWWTLHDGTPPTFPPGPPHPQAQCWSGQYLFFSGGVPHVTTSTLQSGERGARPEIFGAHRRIARREISGNNSSINRTG